MAILKKLGKLVIISGFSGVGKGTVVQKLMGDFDHYALSISMTTRQPRDYEEHGVHYYFVKDKEFEDMIGKNGFLEHAGYVGNYYGTPRAFVEENRGNGIDVILEIEVQGAILANNAIEEAEQMKKYDYVVINDVLDDCVRTVEEIIVNEPDGPRYDPKYKERFVESLKEIIVERKNCTEFSDM